MNEKIRKSSISTVQLIHAHHRRSDSAVLPTTEAQTSFPISGETETMLYSHEVSQPQQDNSVASLLSQTNPTCSCIWIHQPPNCGYCQSNCCVPPSCAPHQKLAGGFRRSIYQHGHTVRKVPWCLHQPPANALTTDLFQLLTFIPQPAPLLTSCTTWSTVQNYPGHIMQVGLPNFFLWSVAPRA